MRKQEQDAQAKHAETGQGGGVARAMEEAGKSGLYTAPHEPCPEGRLILDYEMAISKDYLAIIQEIEQLILDFQPENIVESGKLNFWRSAGDGRGL